MAQVNPPVLGNEPDQTVVAHQWWWELHYIQSGATAANEIHLPVDKDLLLRFESADVKHGFRVPSFGQKIDVIPGHPNHMWLSITGPGLYLVTCNSFCGMGHAHMKIRVFVSEPSVPGRGVDPAMYRSDYHEMLRKEGVPFWPTVVLGDFTFALGVVLVVLLLAWGVGPAEFYHPPDSSLINAHPRPDWYFWWLFAVLALLPHALENYVICQILKFLHWNKKLMRLDNATMWYI